MNNHEAMKEVGKHIQSAVVKIFSDDQFLATGFFISPEGHLLTVGHALNRLMSHINIQFIDGKTTRVKIFKTVDQIINKYIVIKTDCKPGCCLPLGRISDDNVSDEVVVIGYPLGIFANVSIPSDKLLVGRYHGRITRLIDNKIEITGAIKGGGQSGSPVYHFLSNRVVGITEGRVAAKEEMSDTGIAFRFDALFAQWEELNTITANAGASWDNYLRRFDHLKKQLHQAFHLFDQHNESVYSQFKKQLTYHENLYVRRDIDELITPFFAPGTKEEILIITGKTGTGKTSFLLNVLDIMNEKNKALDRKEYQCVFINCHRVNERSLLDAITDIGQVPWQDMGNLRMYQDYFSQRFLVLFFDGLNEYRYFSRSGFMELLSEIASLSKSLQPISLKVLLSIRAEFFQSEIPHLYFIERYGKQSQEYPLEKIYFDHSGERGLPYFEIRDLKKDDIRRFYQHYQDVGELNFSQDSLFRARPRTTFEQLSDNITQLMTRPVIISHFMQRYHQREIPHSLNSFSFLDEINTPQTSVELNLENRELYLINLAHFLLTESDDNVCWYHAIYTQNWHKPDILENLLKDTYLLRREYEPKVGNRIAFSSDWLFEAFLAIYMKRQILTRENPEAKWLFLLEKLYFFKKRQFQDHLVGTLIHLAEWLIKESPADKFLIVRLVNFSDDELNFDNFARSFFELIRIDKRLTPGWDSQSRLPANCWYHLIVDGEKFTKAGYKRLLDYVEELEIIGEYQEGLAVLNLNGHFWSTLDTDLLNRYHLSLAYHYLYSQEKGMANQYAGKANVPGDDRKLYEKRCFILGRVLQYAGDYNKAIRQFSTGFPPYSLFGVLCLHQLAFIKVIHKSDFSAAAKDLNSILDNIVLFTEPERQLESRLLYATCLVRLGQYPQAELILNDIIKMRHKTRHEHKKGTALRARADLNFCRFHTREALEDIDEAIELLQNRYIPSLIYAFDVKAHIEGLLLGHLDNAYNYCSKAISLASAEKKQHKHSASLSWSLQTKFLLDVVAKKEPASEDKEQLQKQPFSPYQAIRQNFILLMSDFLNGEHPPGTKAALEKRIKYLLKRVRQKKLGWFADILNIMLLKLRKKSSLLISLAAANLTREVNQKGFSDSYLFAQIDHAG